MAATGIDEAGGTPAPGLPNPVPAPNWSREAIIATERPRHLDVHGDKVAFVLDRESSDVWVLDPTLRRLTVDRPIAPYWEDVGPRWDPTGTVVAYPCDDAVWITDGRRPRRLCAGSSPVWLDPTRLVVGIERDDRTMLAIASIDEAHDNVLPLPAVEGDLGEVAVRPGDSWIACVRSPRVDLHTSRIVIIDPTTGEVRELAGPDATRDRSPVWAPDGRRIAFASEESGWYEVHMWDLDSGSRTRITDDRADFGEFAWTGHGLAAIRTRHGVADLVRVDPDADLGAPDSVTALGKGGRFASPAWSAGGTLIATHESPTTAPRLVRVDRDGGIEELLAPTPAAVRTAPHVSPEHIWYPAPGGEVPAFLYRPPGRAADRPCPVIVHPHGGPTDHDGEDWHGLVQYFVDKGYAWLAPNFKGSTSYGRDHERANHGVWGVDDTADCLAAHTWLCDQEWADGSRVGIYGASYGSYLALASVVDGDAFACAVAEYGDCNILTSWAQGDRVGRLDLERMMGHPHDNPEGYRAGSPIHRIDRITAPILVAHGELDRRVHPAQSDELVAGLRRVGATYQYVTYPTEAHGFLRREPFLDFTRRLETFLDWYLL